MVPVVISKHQLKLAVNPLNIMITSIEDLQNVSDYTEIVLAINFT